MQLHTGTMRNGIAGQPKTVQLARGMLAQGEGGGGPACSWPTSGANTASKLYSRFLSFHSSSAVSSSGMRSAIFCPFSVSNCPTSEHCQPRLRIYEQDHSAHQRQQGKFDAQRRMLAFGASLTLLNFLGCFCKIACRVCDVTCSFHRRHIIQYAHDAQRVLTLIIIIM